MLFKSANGMSYTGMDVDTAARTIWGEARGENYVTKLCVATVIVNRWEAQTWFGKTVQEVCLKPWQFSCWNENDPNREKLKDAHHSGPVWVECESAIIAALMLPVDWRPLPPTVWHYHDRSVDRKLPAWADLTKLIIFPETPKMRWYQDIR